jgi:hypothetical protein
MNRKENLIIILGAGASVKWGGPDIYQLTERVISRLDDDIKYMVSEIVIPNTYYNLMNTKLRKLY